MNLSKQINDLINEQIGHEMFNSHLYYQIEGWFENKNLHGFGRFFKIQGDETGEQLHARKFIEYINDRNGIVDIPAIEKPSVTFDSIENVMEAYLLQEQDTTERLYKIEKIAIETSDYTTRDFLIWFLNEQIEEENLAQTMLSKAQLIKENPTAILLWNNELEED